MPHDRPQALFVLWPLSGRHEAPPAARQAVAHQAAGLRPAAGLAGPAGEPEEALGAQQPPLLQRIVQEGVEARGVERPARPVGHGGDAIFLGFRQVLAAQFLQPARRGRRAIEIEATGIEDLRQRHLTHHHRQDLRLGIELAQDRQQFLALLAGDQVDLADQDHVGEFDLVDQQVGDRALILLTEGFATTGQAGGLLVVAEKIHPVDHRDHGIQSRHVGQAAVQLVAEGEGLGHRHRFGNPGGLDQQVVEAAFPGETADLFQQVFAQGAADTAVAHLHQAFFSAVQADIALDLAAIDIDFAHIVDDHRNPSVLAVLQHMVEQRALAGAEKAGQHGDR